MTIHFDSWQAVLGFIAVLGLACTAHWKLFAAPLLRKMLTPYGESLDAVTKVIRFRYPAELKDAEYAVAQERGRRGAI